MKNYKKIRMYKTKPEAKLQRQHKTLWVVGVILSVVAAVVALRINFDRKRGEVINEARISGVAGKLVPVIEKEREGEK
jgi:hypothetical protein